MKVKKDVLPSSLPTGLSRRGFLYSALAGTAVSALPSLAFAASAGPSPYGSIAPRDGTGLLLPQGFTARVIAVSGQNVPGTNFQWRGAPDGAATFPDGNGGWYHAVNHELGNGGVSVIRYDANGTIIDAYSVLSGTERNCAGGLTPWGTWLSCEEHSDGLVWECTVTGPGQGVPRPAMGSFNHEAAAVDPIREHVYLTEDRSDGLFYRFTPNNYPSLSAGTLEAARLDGSGNVSWVQVPDPGASNQDTRYQIPSNQITRFSGGEGIWYQDDKVWFTTKGDNGVWEFDLLTNRITKIWNGGAPLTGVDNITVEQGSQDLFVAEDGGNMEIVIIDNQGNVAPFLRVPNQGNSEITGPCFSPDGTRMYFSSQRGTNGNGITYEVTGPFRGTGAPPPPPPPPPPTPTGQIFWLENIEFGGNLTEVASNDIALTSDTGLGAQWELVDIGGGRYHLINQSTGRYLDGDGRGALVGTSSSAASDDEWQLDDFGNEVFTLYNGSHDGYLDANANDRVYLYGDQNADARWRFIPVNGAPPPAPEVVPQDGRSYALENIRYGGFVTEVSSNSIALDGDLASARAHWRFEQVSGDQYHLINLVTGRYLDGDGSGNRVGTSSSPAADDVWELNEFASEVFSFRNVSANRWLDADDDDFIRLWNDEQDDAQWRLIAVD